MKTSKLILFLMALLLLTGVVVGFGFMIHQWILWSYLIFIGIASAIGLSLHLITKNKGKQVELEEPKSKKKAKFSQEDHMGKIKNLLLTRDWADEIAGVREMFTSFLGSENLETPISIIVFKGEYEADEYHSFLNMVDGKLALIQKNDDVSDIEFKEKIKEIKNKLADNPMYIDSTEVIMKEDEFGKPIRIIKKLKETKEDKLKREESKALEESEALGGKE